MSKLKRAEQGLLFLTVLFLPTQLGKHFWPDFSFIYSLPIDYLSPTIYFWDLLVVLLISVSIFGRKKFNRLALNLFLFFILSQVLSLIAFGKEINLGAGLVRLEQYTVSGLFGLYIASQDFKALKHIFLPLTLSVLAVSTLAILQFLKGQTLGLWILGERSFSLSTPGIAKFDFYNISFLRPYSTFPHPNVLAGFMVIVPVILNLINNLPFGRTGSILYRFRIKSQVTILAGLVIILTASRVAMVTAFFEALFILKKKALVFLVLSLILLSPFLYTRFASAFNFDILSFVRREEQSVIAFSLWLKNPLFGVGLNNFIPQASDLLLAGPNRFLQPVHNIFLLSLSETGLIGLLGLISLIGVPIIKLFKRRPFFIIWVSVLFLGLFDHYFLTLPQGYRLLFLVWGLSLSMLKSNSARL